MTHRVCLFAQFDEAPGLPPQTRHYLRQIVQSGYRIHVAVSRDVALSDAALAPWRDGLDDIPVTFHGRRNGGLDFGAWQDLWRAGVTDGCTEILLANDSVFGPLTPLAPLVASMRSRSLDAWGMVASRAVVDHLQSWFVVITAQSWASPAIRRVFEQPFHEMTKDEIVLHGELGLGLAMQAARLKTDACWSSTRGIARLLATNPMHTDWRSVLASGRAPFLKTELLRDNPSAISGIETWRRLIPDSAFFDPAWIEDYLATHPRRPNTRRATWRGRLIQALASENRTSALVYLAKELPAMAGTQADGLRKLYRARSR